jgi:hypothetical protein
VFKPCDLDTRVQLLKTDLLRLWLSYHSLLMEDPAGDRRNIQMRVLLGSSKEVSILVEVAASSITSGSSGFDNLHVHHHQLIHVNPAARVGPFAVVEDFAAEVLDPVDQHRDKDAVGLRKPFAFAVDVGRAHDGDVDPCTVVTDCVGDDGFGVLVQRVGGKAPDFFQ